MSIWTEIAVAIAALLYIAEVVMRGVKQFNARKIQLLIEQHEAMHTNATKAIEGAFEVWWRNGPEQAVRSKALTQLRSLDDTSMLNAVLYTEVIVGRVRGIAMHVALHIYMRVSEQKFIARVPAKIRRPVEKFMTDHQGELDEQRKLLLEYGIEPEALEKRFARTP